MATTPDDEFAEPTPPDESAQRSDVEYYLEVQINLGVPSPPNMPVYVWQSEPTLHFEVANALSAEVSRLIHGLDAMFRQRQEQLGQSYPDMPGLGFYVKNRPVAVGGTDPVPEADE